MKYKILPFFFLFFGGVSGEIREVDCLGGVSGGICEADCRGGVRGGN